jgi:hypothetical protein
MSYCFLLGYFVLMLVLLHLKKETVSETLCGVVWCDNGKSHNITDRIVMKPLSKMYMIQVQSCETFPTLRVVRAVYPIHINITHLFLISYNGPSRDHRKLYASYATLLPIRTVVTMLNQCSSVAVEMWMLFDPFPVLLFILVRFNFSRSQWPRGLRPRSAAEHLLGPWVRIPPGAWMFVLYSVCVVR